MKIITSLLFILIVNFSAYGQEKFNSEKEKILNITINSIQFDSIYSSNKVYFKANDLLSTSSSLKLKKNKKKAFVREIKCLNRKNIDYVSLGDFAIKKNDSKSARLQVYSTETKLTLNIRFTKINNVWSIQNYLIMED